MMEEARLNPAKVDATAIGFVLGPRLNAAGRLATADTSYRLLTAPDAMTARPLADELGRLNLERQRLTQEMVAKAKAQIGASPSAGYLFLVSDESFNPGVVGLVAGRLTEEFYRPALVAHAGPDEAHGSARVSRNSTSLLRSMSVAISCGATAGTPRPPASPSPTRTSRSYKPGWRRSRPENWTGKNSLHPCLSTQSSV